MSELVTGRFLHHANYYDGPLSGVMLADDGNRYWFEVHPECDLHDGYWYALYELTESEWYWEDQRHALFRKHVGTHCDYDENGRRDFRAVMPMPSWDAFYKDPKYGGYGVDVRPDYRERGHVATWDPRGNRPVAPLPKAERSDPEGEQR